MLANPGDRSADDPEAGERSPDAAEIAALADGVLLPCFDRLSAPEWLLRRVSGSLAGVCLFARNVVSAQQVRALTDTLTDARADVVIAIDEEAGDVTRMDAATGSRFPGAAALGRAGDVSLTTEIGAQVGALLSRAGITVNFAPCADVMVDAGNPVIGTRSFGADPALVARHTAAFVKGQQAAGVHACAKHFPGHGDTATDTHTSVAVVDTDAAGLEAVALPPFRAAIDESVALMMAGHLIVPAVDALPASVSHRWLTEILRGEMGFQGVVVTDALEMAAIAGTYGIASGAVMALNAGADLLCLGGEDAGEAMLDQVRDGIVEAVLTGALSIDRLHEAIARLRTLRPDPPTGGADAPLPDAAPAAGTPASGTAASGTAASRAATLALDISGPLPPLTGQVLVLRCQEQTNLAVGDVPWGMAVALAADAGAVPGHRDPEYRHHLAPGSETVVTELTVHHDSALSAATVAALGTAQAVLVLTRDRNRFPWMNAFVAEVRRTRPDAVLVEMGVGGIADADAPAVASYGAGLANALAVLAALRLPPRQSP